MIVLAPVTTEQEFNILPREPSILTDLTLVITEEGSKTSETISSLTAFENKDMICIATSFTILKENNLYKIAITDVDGNNWWRGKARCTAATDFKLKYDNNSIADTDFITLTDDETFTTLL